MPATRSLPPISPLSCKHLNLAPLTKVPISLSPPLPQRVSNPPPPSSPRLVIVVMGTLSGGYGCSCAAADVGGTGFSGFAVVVAVLVVAAAAGHSLVPTCIGSVVWMPVRPCLGVHALCAHAPMLYVYALCLCTVSACCVHEFRSACTRLLVPACIGSFVWKRVPAVCVYAECAFAGGVPMWVMYPCICRMCLCGWCAHAVWPRL